MKLVFIILFFFAFGAHAQTANNFILKGNELYKKGDFKNAQIEYEKALQAEIKNATAQFNNGNALQKQGNFADAAKQFQGSSESTKDIPLKASSNYNQGVAEVKQKQLQEAVSSFKQSLRLNPSDVEARDNLQKALNELKKQDQKQKPKDNKQQEKKPQEQKKDNPLNKQQAENLLNQLRQEEKRLQEMQKQKIKQVRPEKDW